MVDVGPRQAGRERGPNVAHVGWDAAAIRRAVEAAVARRHPRKNLYGGRGTGRRIAAVLAAIEPGPRLLRKLIAY